MKINTDYLPLFAIKRGKYREIVVHGLWGWSEFDHGKTVFKYSMDTHKDTPIIARSLLKPWQAIATGLISKEEDSAWMALGLASQSAQEHQQKTLEEILKKSGIEASQLKCPSVFPMDRKQKSLAIEQGKNKSTLFHPCAGKHSFALWSCKKNSWPLENYLSPSHPLQKKLGALLATSLGKSPESIDWVTDSCGLPSAVLTLKEHLTLWQNLASSLATEPSKIRELWSKYPEFIGGIGRLDTEIVLASKNRVMSKEGADGLLVTQDTSAPTFQGVLVKIACGFFPNYLALGTLAVLNAQKEKLSPAMRLVLEFLLQRSKPGGDWINHDQELELLL